MHFAFKFLYGLFHPFGILLAELERNYNHFTALQFCSHPEIIRLKKIKIPKG